jgi:hypothetical protein
VGTVDVKFQEIMKRVDRVIDILDKFAITYSYSQSPMAKGQMQGDQQFPPAYNQASGKSYGLNDRKGKPSDGENND